jgi:hypothetical protein
MPWECLHTEFIMQHHFVLLCPRRQLSILIFWATLIKTPLRQMSLESMLWHQTSKYSFHTEPILKQLFPQNKVFENKLVLFIVWNISKLVYFLAIRAYPGEWRMNQECSTQTGSRPIYKDEARVATSSEWNTLAYWENKNCKSVYEISLLLSMILPTVILPTRSCLYLSLGLYFKTF